MMTGRVQLTDDSISCKPPAPKVWFAKLQTIMKDYRSESLATEESKNSINRKFKTNAPILLSPDCVDARAFSKMRSEEQLKFIQRRFASIDSSELVNIVKAIYGQPHDKGRPRRNSSSRGTAKPSLSLRLPGAATRA